MCIPFFTEKGKILKTPLGDDCGANSSVSNFFSVYPEKCSHSRTPVRQSYTTELGPRTTSRTASMANGNGTNDCEPKQGTPDDRPSEAAWIRSPLSAPAILMITIMMTI